MTDKIDSKIAEYLEKVKQRKKEVRKAEDEAGKKWITTGSFPPLFGGSVNINIQTTSEDGVLMILAQLRIHQTSYNQAAKELGLDPVTKYAGFDYESWAQDCRTRLARIQLTDKKAKLAELEKRLDSIISPELRRQMEIDAIASELDD